LVSISQVRVDKWPCIRACSFLKFLSCSCCGSGLLEIKCPYSAIHTTPKQVSCLQTNEEGYKLSRRHEYFYQILGQLGILQGPPYCDFVCQTLYGTMHIERIPLDPSFFTDMCIKLLLSESFSLVLCSIGGKHGTL